MNWKALGLAGLLTFGVASCKEEYKIQDPPNMLARCQVGDLTMFIIGDDLKLQEKPPKCRDVRFYDKEGKIVSWFDCRDNDSSFTVYCNDGSYHQLYNGKWILKRK